MQNATAEKQLSYEELAAAYNTSNGIISDLKQQNTELTNTVTLLLAQLKQLQRHVFGRRSERFDNETLPLFPDGVITPITPAPEKPEELITVEEHQRKKHRGRNPIPAELPRKTCYHDIPDKHCPCCGLEMQHLGDEIKEQLEYEPAQMYVNQHIRPNYVCSKCKNGVVTAKLPEDIEVFEKGKPGPGLLAYLAVSKYCDHLPLHRLEQIFRRHGIEIPRSTLCDWIKHVAEACQPLYQRLCELILEAYLIHADETHVMIRNELDHYEKGYFWGYHNDSTIAVFEASDSRSGEIPKKFLKDFANFLQADAYGGYNSFIRESQAKRVGCWAHVRRKFYDARTSDAERSKQMLILIRKLYLIEREIKEHPPDLKHKVRLEQSVPILNEIHQTLLIWQNKVLPKSPIGEAITYALNQWAELTIYTTDGNLVIDNSAIERQIRPLAIGRKNWLFSGSLAGAQRSAILFSIIATCKLNKVNPFEYLRDVLVRVNSTPKANIDSLLPQIWQPAEISKN